MKAKELRDIAARLNRIADEMEGIKTDGGTIRVTLPQPDLFSQMGLTTDDTMGRVDDLVASVRPETDIPAEPQRRTWKRVGVQMKDEAIVAAEKVGRKSGWCQRSDIERSLQRRNPERSREEIREAVNAAVKEMRLTCVKYNSYRFYRTADRGLIIASVMARLTA